MHIQLLLVGMALLGALPPAFLQLSVSCWLVQSFLCCTVSWLLIHLHLCRRLQRPSLKNSCASQLLWLRMWKLCSTCCHTSHLMLGHRLPQVLHSSQALAATGGFRAFALIPACSRRLPRCSAVSLGKLRTVSPSLLAHFSIMWLRSHIGTLVTPAL